MTLALLDTNSYLRLAKRVRPLLGVPFGQKQYVLTVLLDVEREVKKSQRLSFRNPWFDEEELAEERDSKRVRLSVKEKGEIAAMQSIMLAHVRENVDLFVNGQHASQPPGKVDCFCLAFGEVRSAIVVTDDLSMHTLAADFELKVWHGYEVLAKMLTAKAIDKDKVVEVYDALKANDDLTRTWREAKHTVFKKVFGSLPIEE